jgi:hypothetical protein
MSFKCKNSNLTNNFLVIIANLYFYFLNLLYIIFNIWENSFREIEEISEEVQEVVQEVEGQEEDHLWISDPHHMLFLMEPFCIDAKMHLLLNAPI